MKEIRRIRGLAVLVVLLAGTTAVQGANSNGIPALTIQGENFVDAGGKPVKFWGVNLVAVYPEHAKADALAANLASLGVNLVRPHHLLRPSLDWNPKMVSGSLAQYKDNSRDFETNALDRFDYLNNALRQRGIYLALSAHFSRKYLPGDVDILTTDDKDRTAWMAAMRELNGWGWQKSIDPYKMLPTVDERAALLNEEFVRKLLTHVNTYSGLAYAADPQVLTLEVLNEASTEYAVMCGNKLPPYYQAKLVEKWEKYAAAAGIEAGDLYKPADAKASDVRAKFLQKLDQDYFDRIKAAVQGTGCRAAIMFSNLWRGDNALEMHSRLADVLENHNYMDPLVVRTLEDGIGELTKSAVAGKPFIVGELNQAESSESIRRQGPVRTMLPLAVSAYGSLQNWSGIIWFAWMHGDLSLGSDGWSLMEGRTPKLGELISDGMMTDHLRTTGIIFRRGLVEKSSLPMTIAIDEPFTASDYAGLMRGKYVPRPGWQGVHAVRKNFGPAPADQGGAAWQKQSPTNLVVSDTGQIIKDIDRKQLTVAAPKTEAFSGYLDGKPPAGLQHLLVEGDGFATVVAVADDGENLAASRRLIISRTGLDAANAETRGPRVRLAGLMKPSDTLHWYIRLTRPRPAAALLKDFAGLEFNRLEASADGTLELPLAGWHECELHLRP